MDISTMVGLGAGGAIAMCWNHIKGFAGRIIGLFVVTVTVRSYLERSVSAYVWAKARREKGCYRVYYSDYVNSRKEGKSVSCVFEEQSGAASLCWLHGVPMIVKREVPDKSSPSHALLHLTFLRGTVDPDKLVADADHFFRGFNAASTGITGVLNTRFFVHVRVGESKSLNKGGSFGSNPHACGYSSQGISDRPVNMAVEDLGFELPDARGNYLALSPEVEGYVEEARAWMAGRAWYRERSIPWRRGWGIFGAPGNGKSSLAKTLGITLDLPIYSLNLGSMNNTEFRKYWEEATNASPAIVLFEDFDNVFHGRTNIIPDSELTFDTILNAVSGVQGCDGVFLIVTTNHIEHLDPALGAPGVMSSRPGRLDRVFEMKAPDADGRRKIAQRILFDVPEAVDAAVAATADMSGAQVQEFLTTEALKRKAY